jgi:hypothetical protein
VAGDGQRLGAHLPSEDGTSPIVASVAVAVFLGFLLLASQTLLHLYALSTASAAAADAARRVAAVGGTCDDGHAQVTALLGGWGDHVTVACQRRAGEVEVRVTGPSPARLAGGIAARIGIGEVDRAAIVPLEVAP